MSVHKFGRLTPAQGYLLGLIGYRLTRSEATLEIPDSDRMENMRRAREQLIGLTGQDFGYDLLRWHNFLAQNDEFEYTHPYAYPEVKKALAAAQKDSQRLRIIINFEDKKVPPIDSNRCHKKARRLSEKYAQPNPPRMGPPVANDEVLLDVWKWAEAWEFTEILAKLALPACSLLHSPGEKDEMHTKLHNFAREARRDGRIGECADFLVAQAKLQPDRDLQLGNYRQALALYQQSDDWAGEAFTSMMIAELNVYKKRFDDAHLLWLHSYQIWARKKHKKGIGISLVHLASKLERDGKYREACQFNFRAKSLLRDHITYITARDILNRIAFEHKIAPEECETNKSAEELVAEVFGI